MKGNYFSNLYHLKFNFLGYYCDHQDPTSPIKRELDYVNFLFSINSNINYYQFNWQIIQYKEEKSLSGMFRSV